MKTLLLFLVLCLMVIPASSNHLTCTETPSITVVGDALNIMYSSTEESSIKLVVVDLLGNTLVNQRVNSTAGTHYYTIDTKDRLTCPYFVSVVSALSQINKNIVIIK